LASKFEKSANWTPTKIFLKNSKKGIKNAELKTVEKVANWSHQKSS
jgi:hypothetical protein